MRPRFSEERSVTVAVDVVECIGAAQIYLCGWRRSERKSSYSRNTLARTQGGRYRNAFRYSVGLFVLWLLKAGAARLRYFSGGTGPQSGYHYGTWIMAVRQARACAVWVRVFLAAKCRWRLCSGSSFSDPTAGFEVMSSSVSFGLCL